MNNSKFKAGDLVRFNMEEFYKQNTKSAVDRYLESKNIKFNSLGKIIQSGHPNYVTVEFDKGGLKKTVSFPPSYFDLIKSVNRHPLTKIFQ
jgi:hypothetical protein